MDKAHGYARARGISRPLYRVARILTIVVLRGWFRVRIQGAERVGAAGPAILAPNHKNFLDPFFVGIATRRPVHYMAKVELLTGPMGWLFLRLGAFPVRRGGSDAESLETARAILSRGGAVVVFPEGTRVEQADALGSPHHGAARLALQTGAPIFPVALTGTSHLWRGALPKFRRVQITFLEPVSPEGVIGAADPLSELMDGLVWPAVQEEYGRLRARSGLAIAGLAAVGVGSGLLVRRQREARRKPALLGKVEPRRIRRQGRTDALASALRRRLRLRKNT